MIFGEDGLYNEKYNGRIINLIYHKNNISYNLDLILVDLYYYNIFPNGFNNYSDLCILISQINKYRYWIINFYTRSKITTNLTTVITDLKKGLVYPKWVIRQI